MVCAVSERRAAVGELPWESCRGSTLVVGGGLRLKNEKREARGEAMGIYAYVTRTFVPSDRQSPLSCNL